MTRAECDKHLEADVARHLKMVVPELRRLSLDKKEMEKSIKEIKMQRPPPGVTKSVKVRIKNNNYYGYSFSSNSDLHHWRKVIGGGTLKVSLSVPAHPNPIGYHRTTLITIKKLMI